MLLVLFTPLPIKAISGRHDVDEQAYRHLATSYPEVGRFGYGSKDDFGSGVLIASHWVLLASHNLIIQTGPFTFEIGGNVHHADWSKRHFAELPAPNSASFELDIALLHLIAPVENVTPAAVYDGRDEVGKLVTLVGFGKLGDGLNGVPLSGSTDRKRAANNILDATGNYENAPDVNPVGTLLFYDFDNPSDVEEKRNWFGGSNTPLPLEGMTTSGDSGGGVFVETSPGRRLIGINSGSFGEDGAPTGSAGDEHLYGVGSRTVRVSSFLNWIGATITHFESGREPLVGLVAHWSFDEKSGEYAHDVSGVGHRGTIVNTLRVSDGVIGGALAFHSSLDTFPLPMTAQDYVEVPNETQVFYDAGSGIANDLKIEDDISVSAWISRRKSGGATGAAETDVDTIVCKIPVDGSVASDFAFIIWEDHLRFYRGDNDYVPSENVPELEDYEKWQHLVVTRKGSTVTFYRNSVPIGSGALTGKFSTTDNPLIIGNHPSPGLDLSGMVDEVRIYNRALADTEVAALFEFEKPSPQGSTNADNIRFVGGFQIIENVPSGTDVNAFTVPPRVNVMLTDLIISNPNASPSCCAQILGDETARTGSIIVPAEDTVVINFMIGIEFTSGTVIRLRNSGSAGPLGFTIRGYRFTLQ